MAIDNVTITEGPTLVTSGATPALVAHLDWQQNGVDPSSSINTTGATLLVMSIGQYIQINNAAPTVSDSFSNTWQLAGRAANPPTASGGAENECEYLFYAANAKVGNGHSFTTTMSSGYPSQQVAAFSGITTVNPLFAANGFYTGSGGSPVSIQPGIVTPTQPNSLIITAQGNFVNTGTGANATVNDGFTISNQDAAVFAQNQGSGLAYLVQGAAAPINPTWTLSSTTNQFDFMSVIAVFTPSQTVIHSGGYDTVTAIQIKGGSIAETGHASDTTNFLSSTWAGAVVESGHASDTVGDAGSIFNSGISEQGHAVDANNIVGSTFSSIITEQGHAADSSISGSTYGVAILEAGAANDVFGNLPPPVAGYFFPGGVSSGGVSSSEISAGSAINLTTSRIFPIVPGFSYPTGSLPIFTAANFLQAMLLMMPRGRAWPQYPSSNMYQTLAALVPSFAASSQASTNLLVDIYPGQTLNLLPEWEESLGLPDPCAGAPASTSQARNQVIAKFINTGGQSPPYIINYASQLGFAITITEQPPAFLVGLDCPGVNYVGDDYAPFYWIVNSPLFTVSLFQVGINVAGDALGSFISNTVLECELQAIAPANTQLVFSFH